MKDTIVCGNALHVLTTLPCESVQCCITSPPYYGLRDYGTAQWEGGSPECDHKATRIASPRMSNVDIIPTTKGDCSKCGATRIDCQIGLEETPEAYISRLVDVFREVRRVLRSDGTLWVNIGDSYASQAGQQVEQTNTSRYGAQTGAWNGQSRKPADGLKPKDLIGIPWMLAFALRADGWYLRSDIIWHKPNAMPESVKDRPTKAHEYLFLLSKNERYFYDAQAIVEPAVRPGDIQTFGGSKGRNYTPEVTDPNYRYGKEQWGRTVECGSTRNKRSVWSIASQPYSEAHFATFPPKLIEPCILAGSKPGDIVLDCFMGAGTTALVALQHGRSYLGIELNPEYVKLIEKRIAEVQQNLWTSEGIA